MMSVCSERGRGAVAGLAVLILAAVSLGGAGLAPKRAAAAVRAQPISWVDTTKSAYDKHVLLVDGKPFHHSGIQFRYEHQKYQKGWTDAELKPVLKMIAEDGFDVVNIPIWWSQVEPEKDAFDWTDLERYIDWCDEFGLKLELLWFSHESTGHSQRIRVPDYVWNDYTLVVDANGVPLQRDGHHLFDKTDPHLLEREKYVLGKVMEQLAAYDTRHTTVGIQVGNEPNVAQLQWGVAADRSYSRYSNTRWDEGGYTDAGQFRRDVLLHYLTELGRVVKESGYSVYTRANTVGDARPVAENEALRSRGANTIDFFGYDPYTTDIGTIYNYGINSMWMQGRNFPMIMESYAGTPTADRAKFNAIAGNSVYNMYAATDGYAESGSSDLGLYDFDPVTHAVTRKAVSHETAALNHMINKVRTDLATKAPQDAGGRFLQTYNRTEAATSDTTRPLAGLDPRYATSAGGQGIAIERSDEEYALLSTKAGTFSLPADHGTVLSVQSGYYDGNNTWVSQGDKPYDVTGGKINIALGAGEAVRVAFDADTTTPTTLLVARHSGKCADVTSASSASGAAVVQYTCNGGANQRWRWQSAGDGYYRIVATHSGKCAEVAGGSTANGAWLQQADCQTGEHQQWRLRDTGNGYVQIIARHSGKCLDVNGVSAANDARLQQWDCNTGDNQQWRR